MHFQGFSNGGFFFGYEDDYNDIQITMSPLSHEGMEFGPVTSLANLAKLNASVYVVAMGRSCLMSKDLDTVYEGEIGQNLRPPLSVIVGQPELRELAMEAATA